MGMHDCPEHGWQDGEMTCSHVSVAVYAQALETAGTPRPPVLRVQVDLVDDGSYMLDTFVCGECADKYSLPNDTPVTGAHWESETKFPKLELVCSACLGRWLGYFPGTKQDH